MGNVENNQKEYLEFAEWIHEIQVPRVVSRLNIHYKKWILSNVYGVAVYLTTKELFKHFQKNKSLTI